MLPRGLSASGDYEHRGFHHGPDQGCLIASIAAIPLLAVTGTRVPRSVYLIDLALCALGCCAVRVVVRELRLARAPRNGGPRKRILIYGAGDAGVKLMREVRANAVLGFRVCGFIDDDPGKRSMLIQGIPVLGTGTEMKRLVEKHPVDEILIATPSAGGDQMQAILDRCHAAGVKCRTIPGLSEIIIGTGLLRQVREVAMEDILGRSVVRLDESEIARKLDHQVVLVTGAAGSIGSEICRQVARYGPKLIVGFDCAETPLFHIQNEMKKRFPDVPFLAAIGSVQDEDRLQEVFHSFQPQVVYHAAAYKHVPLMEQYPFAALATNVIGSVNVARIAARNAVETFVMISSDKAVRPTSVMGATKRLAEMFIPSFQNDRMKAVSVRFGNVLGSNGSVIPAFQAQIAAGGPVTVTHPEMRRYFMAIPEAAQLVLQASTMGSGGEVFVLDMGRPVKIVDIARKMITLSGSRPGIDIQIEFTGIRPGEKLYEEISAIEEEMLPTHHEKVRVFSTASFSREEARTEAAACLRMCAERRVSEFLLYLKDRIPEYNPSSLLLQRALEESVSSSTTLRSFASVTPVEHYNHSPVRTVIAGTE